MVTLKQKPGLLPFLTSIDYISKFFYTSLMTMEHQPVSGLKPVKGTYLVFFPSRLDEQAQSVLRRHQLIDDLTHYDRDLKSIVTPFCRLSVQRGVEIFRPGRNDLEELDMDLIADSSNLRLDKKTGIYTLEEPYQWLHVPSRVLGEVCQESTLRAHLTLQFPLDLVLQKVSIEVILGGDMNGEASKYIDFYITGKLHEDLL